MELLDQYAGTLSLKRMRNASEASLTFVAKCPHLCVLVWNALLFKGEDKYEEGKLDLAVVELKQKMRCWSQSYHGQVDMSLCICPHNGCRYHAMQDSVVDIDHARPLLLDCLL